MPLPTNFSRSKKKDESAYSAVEVDPNKSTTDVSSNSATPVLDGWPTGPERIATAPIWIIADILLLLMPIAFIGTFTIYPMQNSANDPRSPGCSRLQPRWQTAL